MVLSTEEVTEPVGPSTEPAPSPVAQPWWAQRRTLTMAFALVVVVQCSWAMWQVSHAFFFQDDFVNLNVARQLGFGPKLLEQSVFGHLVPGFNLVNRIVGLGNPFQFRIVEAWVVILFALTLVLLYRLLTMLIGPSWLCVFLTGLAGSTFGLVPAFVWWSDALEQLVAIPATLLAVHLHVRFLERGQWRYAVGEGVAIAVGLAFYDGVVVSVCFIGLLTVLVFPAGKGMSGALRAAARCWPAWICVGVPVAVDLLWRYSHPGVYEGQPAPTLVHLGEFLWLTLVQTFAPLLVGIDSWLLGTKWLRMLVDGMGSFLVISAVVVSIVRQPSAWRPWAVFFMTFLLMGTVVGLNRLVLGVGDAADVRYITFDTFFFAIVCTVAFRRPAVHPLYAAPERAPKHRRVGRRPRTSAVVVAVLAVLVLVAVDVVALPFDASHYFPVSESRSARQFFHTVATTWSVATRHVRDPTLWNTELTNVVASAFFPYDTAASTVGHIVPGIPFDVWGGSGFLVLPNGTVARAVPVTVEMEVLPGGTCLTTGPAAAALSVPLNHPLPAARWFTVVQFSRSSGFTTVQSGGATVSFPRGHGTLLSATAPTPMKYVDWVVPPRSHICIDGVRVVQPVQAAPTR